MSPLSVGTELKFVFDAGGGRAIAAVGKVVHAQPGIGMGVEFTSVAGDGFQLISDLVTGAGRLSGASGAGEHAAYNILISQLGHLAA